MQKDESFREALEFFRYIAAYIDKMESGQEAVHERVSKAPATAKRKTPYKQKGPVRVVRAEQEHDSQV